MDGITIIYLVYTFIAFYFLFLFLLIYFQNKKDIYTSPPVTKEYALSVVIPCFNEAKTIEGTIQTLLDSDYKGLKKIIVSDDCSTDGSYDIAKKFAKKHKNVMVVQTPKNTGNAAGAKNYGAQFVNTELIGFTDADSFHEKDSVRKMIGFFDDPKVGAVTSNVLVKNRDNFILKLQSIEYKVIKFSRKLLEFIDSIYVTPGPLGIYRKSAFDKIKGFDGKNLTEDIEITWHLQYEGYKIKMSADSRAYAVSPTKIKEWIKQRNRWNIGGLQTIGKYGKSWFKKGMLGNFILPLFVLSWVVGLFGIGVLFYRLFNTLVFRYLATTYSVKAHTALLSFNEINLFPSVLVLLGITVFLFSLIFTFLALSSVREKGYKRENWFTIGFYMIFYLLAYPIILITSMVKFLRGNNKW
jgi:poly-beta-1,6-N-acetyl-D-glucosamine synthase